MKSPLHYASHWRRPLFAVILAASPLLCGCPQEEPTRWDPAQQATQGQPAVSKSAVAGSEFNKLFPKSEGEYEVIFAQEKDGFALANLAKGGTDVATLAISDTVSNPDAKEKFKSSQETFDIHPIVEVDDNTTAILVADRFQVQVRSKDANFSKFDREDWLRKFDLANLANLQ